MDRERGSQAPLPQFDTEIAINLRTGGARLRRRRATPTNYREEEKRIIMSQWQIDLPETLARAAGSWHAAKTTQQAEELGIDVEYAGSQMTAADTEALLVAKFEQAHGLHLTALDVVTTLHGKITAMRDRLGERGDWLSAFLNHTIDQLANVYGLSQRNTIDLKRVALQHRLPGFVSNLKV